MTRFSLAKSIGYCAALLCVAILCTPACLAQAGKSGASEELAALLSKHDDSLNGKNLDALAQPVTELDRLPWDRGRPPACFRRPIRANHAGETPGSQVTVDGPLDCWIA
jgi:hypothetical protein